MKFVGKLGMADFHFVENLQNLRHSLSRISKKLLEV